MVGFKSIWLLLSLLIFAACVPQTKQTECGSNEAFNAALRSCVPIVNGPSSFIHIQSFLPTSALTKYKNDTTPVTFSVVITNPYAQAYTLEWERVYNGIPVPIVPSTATSYSFPPSLLSSQVGTHIISVKVVDAANNIVDSHSFEIKINDNPKPVITSASVTPALYASTYTPAALPVNFSFTVNNNGATMTGAGYRTDWSVFRNGVPIDAETDTFPTSSPLGSLSSNGFNYPVYAFNPLLIDGIQIGAYVIRAVVTNTAAEIVAEQQRSVTVAHPNLSKVTSRNIYSAASPVGYATVSTAYDGVAYTDYNSLNVLDRGFIPNNVLATTQGDYCVTIANPEGTYPADSLFVRVDYFIDGGPLLYSGYTSNAVNGNKVCLSASGAGVLANVAFTNTIPNITQSHTLVARVVDEATGQEYTQSDMNGSLGTYPISWAFSVKPANAAPTVSFTATGNLSNISCAAAVGVNKACNVTQGSTFTLGVAATDDFYSSSSTTDSVQAHFTYTMTLYRGATVVSTCDKTFAEVNPDTGLPGTDFVGPDYLCNFSIPTYDANGSIDPTAEIWSVGITVGDDGSPISGSSAATSSTYNYVLTVAEASTAPTISAQGTTIATDSYLTVNWVNPGTHTSAASSVDPLGNAASASFVTEGDTLNFNIRVADPEMDDYGVEIYYCFDNTLACAVPVNIVALSPVLKTDNAATKLTSYSYLIPENLVPITSALTADIDSYFKVRVTDDPDFLVGLPAEIIMSTNVRNKNPAPVVTTASQVPASTGPHKVTVGYPFSIDPGPVADGSLVASEATLSYQWYVSPDNTTFTAIGGATSRILIWTPSLVYGSTAYLKLCVSDSTTIYPLSGDFAGVCTGTRASSSFQIDIKSNMTTAEVTGVVGVFKPSTGAVWHDTTAGDENVTYMASVEYDTVLFDYFINVSKMVRDTTTGAWSNSFKNVRFKALQSVVADLPSDLSITGTSTSLYVAYKCAPASAPTSAKACVRRIEKGYTAGTEEKTNLVHKGKFGFSYTGVTISTSDASISYTAPVAGATYDVAFNATPIGGGDVTINGVIFTSNGNANSTVDANEFCAATIAGCTATTAAQQLVDLINQSVNPVLQGISASLSGNTVVIKGMKVTDSYDSTITVLGLGKISTDNTLTNWHLPVINSSLAGANLNRVSVLSSALNSHLNSTAVTTTDLLTMNRAASIATEIDANNNLVIAMISTEPTLIGQGRLYNVALAGSIYAGAVTTLTTSLFSGEGISSIRLAASRGINNFNYVVALGNTTNKWKVGRYDESTLALSNISEQDMEDLTPNPGTGADDVLVYGEVQDIQVIADPAINGEARLAVSNFGVTVTDGFYLLRWTATNILKCAEDTTVGICTPISVFTTDVDSRIYLSASQSSVAIGASGYTASENTTDVIHAIMFPSATVPATPRHLMINIVPESIYGNDTSLPDGTSGWRPPYVR